MLYVSYAKNVRLRRYLCQLTNVCSYTQNFFFFFLQNYQKLLIRLKYCPFYRIRDSNIKKSEQTNQIGYFYIPMKNIAIYYEYCKLQSN